MCNMQNGDVRRAGKKKQKGVGGFDSLLFTDVVMYVVKRVYSPTLLWL